MRQEVRSKETGEETNKRRRKERRQDENRGEERKEEEQREKDVCVGCLLLLHSHPIILANCMISSASPASHHEWELKASLVEYIAADRITCTDSLSLSLSLS